MAKKTPGDFSPKQAQAWAEQEYGSTLRRGASSPAKLLAEIAETLADCEHALDPANNIGLPPFPGSDSAKRLLMTMLRAKLAELPPAPAKIERVQIKPGAFDKR
jgi:hypothetical protein